jgi:hypothetical protein
MIIVNVEEWAGEGEVEVPSDGLVFWMALYALVSFLSLQVFRSSL